MTEKQLQQNVQATLRAFGWMSYHTWLSVRSVAGYPDIVAIRGNRLIAIELKSERGDVRPEQQEWLDAFAAAGSEAVIWRPSDWLSGEIEERLR